MRHHFLPVRMALTKGQETSTVEGAGKGNPSALLVRLQTGAVCGYSRVLKTLKIELQYDRTAPPLGINPHPHPQKINTLV